ncbi:GNAT family N-acetyltransferase [Rossellomorea marisflavi]|uniref:GNAT family N-acetyltransferase n=1 Tax=Rossellomorea marisflavi TaxID=189381 RepID=UPI0027A6CF52|nr:GNAT family N-acetyltransferase [Rossellomorea marisflavi]UTE72435.1 GNAT family N-acetyltransferase [Rossellomorea marisflavi]
MELLLQRAEKKQIDTIMDIYERCREELEQQGLLQWGDGYPSRDYFLREMEAGSLYVLLADGILAGCVTLNEWQSPEWEDISWKYGDEWVVHAYFLDPEYQGQGLGSAFLGECETLAASKGYKSIRLDAYGRNKGANVLYEKSGYEYRGSIRFTSRPEGHQEYHCYEKHL